MKKIDRLQFLQMAGGILGAATAAAACGGDDAAAGAACNPSAPVASISGNHGHVMTVTAAQVTAGVTMTYMSIKGQADHDHTVMVSKESFAGLANGTSAVAYSSASMFDGHVHTITIC